jgi:hypothetical protein
MHAGIAIVNFAALHIPLDPSVMTHEKLQSALLL